MNDEDLATVRRFAAALPEEPYGAPILRVIGELERLRRELKRFGDLPCEAAFYIDRSDRREPEQLMFRRPDGRLVVLSRDRQAS